MRKIKYLSKAFIVFVMILSIFSATLTTCFAFDTNLIKNSDGNNYLGDANLDGEINLVDVTSIQRHLAELTLLKNETAMYLADVDRDNNISLVDVTYIQRFLANLPCPDGIGQVFPPDVQTDSKTLIVYFSWSSNTETMANYIHDKIGGDIERIEPVNAYPTNYNETADKAKAERDNGDRPEFKSLEYNPEDYDIIFIGYPIWWYELPMIMRTFFDTYDFSGKTIVPFNTHEGSGDGGTYQLISQLEPNATVLEGLAIRGGDISNDSSKDRVISWIEGLNLE